MSVRNLFRDAIFDWLKETFQDGYEVTIKSRAVAYVRRGATPNVLVRVMADAVRVGGDTFMSDDPKFFDNVKNGIITMLDKSPEVVNISVVNGKVL